jgi:hypothetical protein
MALDKGIMAKDLRRQKKERVPKSPLRIRMLV